MAMRVPGALRVPDSMPVLTRGKHRRPRNGACLMEYVSVLAGEPFSDAPACTDPVLGAIARAVNDYSGDDMRQRLAVLASDLTTMGPLDIAAQQSLARRCLLTAIPHSCEHRRRVLIVGLLGLERAAAGTTHGFSQSMVGLDAEFALMGCETALREAVERLELLPVDLDQHHARGLAASIEMAVATIAQECRDADELLYRLLVDCLDDHRGGRATTGVAERSDSSGVTAGRELPD
jgi:hypothetical protein